MKTKERLSFTSQASFLSRIAGLSGVKKNVLANYGGQLFGSLLGFILVPVYISYIGIEGYGLVGFFAFLTTVVTVLDLGLTPVVQYETARLAALPGEEQRLRDLLRTLEYIYGVIGIAIGLCIVLSSSWIAQYWVRPVQLSDEDVKQSIMLMGICLACRWPFSLYGGGLIGLQRQVTLNWILGLEAIARAIGSLLILWLISPTIQAFLLWQVCTGLFRTVLSASYLKRGLPKALRMGTFKTEIVADIWRFSMEINIGAVFFVILSQMDKIVLSRLLSLESFGYYSFASAAAGAVLSVVKPLQAALFPRFSELVSLGDRKGLTSLYHGGCQLVTTLSMTVSIVGALFSSQILLAWTGNPVLTRESSLVLTILIIANGIHSVMHLPYSLQLSHRWGYLNMMTHLVGVVILFPLLIVLAGLYGAVGGALVWLLFNLGSFVLTIHFMHKRILESEKIRWYVHDVGLPTLGAVGVAAIARLLVPEHLSRPLTAVWLIVVLGLSLLASALAAGEIRGWLFARMAELYGFYRDRKRCV